MDSAEGKKLYRDICTWVNGCAADSKALIWGGFWTGLTLIEFVIFLHYVNPNNCPKGLFGGILCQQAEFGLFFFAFMAVIVGLPAFLKSLPAYLAERAMTKVVEASRGHVDKVERGRIAFLLERRLVDDFARLVLQSLVVTGAVLPFVLLREVPYVDVVMACVTGTPPAAVLAELWRRQRTFERLRLSLGN